MSIRSRILALVGSFAIMALAVTAVGLVTLSDYNRMMDRFDRAYLNAWRGEHLNRLVSQVVMESRGLYMARDPEETPVFAGNLNRNLDEMEQLLAEWRAGVTQDDTALFEALATDATEFIALRREVARLGAAGDPAGAERLGVGNRAKRIAFQRDVEAMVQATRSEMAIARAEADRFEASRTVEFLAVSLTGIAIMLAIALWVVSHFVTRPLQTLADAIVKTSKGEYDAPLGESDGKDEVATLWRAVTVLKERSIEHERMAQAQREAERQDELKLREILLD